MEVALQSHEYNRTCWPRTFGCVAMGSAVFFYIYFEAQI